MTSENRLSVGPSRAWIFRVSWQLAMAWPGATRQGARPTGVRVSVPDRNAMAGRIPTSPARMSILGPGTAVGAWYGQNSWVRRARFPGFGTSEEDPMDRGQPDGNPGSSSSAPGPDGGHDPPSLVWSSVRLVSAINVQQMPKTSEASATSFEGPLIGRQGLETGFHVDPAGWPCRVHRTPELWWKCSDQPGYSSGGSRGGVEPSPSGEPREACPQQAEA